MLEKLDLSSMAGPMASGGIVVFLAKLYLSRALKDLEDVVKNMSLVQKDLAIIAVRLSQHDKNEEIIKDLSKRMVLMESKLINSAH